MNQHQKWVQEFHEAMGGVVNHKPTMIDHASRLRRVRLIVEEAGEFAVAASKDDMVEMCDALADLLYVTYGSAVELGVDIEPIFAEVQRSNMSKLGGGQDSAGKIMKGPNFTVPDILCELRKQGWHNG